MRPLLIVYLMCRVFSVFVPGVNPLHAGTPEDSARTGGASAWPKTSGDGQGGRRRAHPTTDVLAGRPRQTGHAPDLTGRLPTQAITPPDWYATRDTPPRATGGRSNRRSSAAVRRRLDKLVYRISHVLLDDPRVKEMATRIVPPVPFAPSG